MAKKQHKPVLFDQIFAPAQEIVAVKKALRNNRLRFLLSGAARSIIIVIGSVVGSFVFTVAINALVQERGFAEVASELLGKFLNLFR